VTRVTIAPTPIRHAPQRLHHPVRWLAVLLTATAVVLLVQHDVSQHAASSAARPELQRLLDAAVTGPYGKRVTLTQLLTHRSGMVDDNVVTARPDYYLALIEDPNLRVELLDLARRWMANPALEFSPLVWVRVAAAVPPLFPPGSDYHYSNTGFEVLGLVAGRATGKSMAALYRERILSPLGLRDTAWDPQGPIAGLHSRGYRMNSNGTFTDVTDWHAGKGAEGAVVANAAETAHFLTALMTGRLLHERQLDAMKNGGVWAGGDETGCAGLAFGHSGGDGFKTNVWVSGDGSRVAVLLLNGRRDERTDIRAATTLARLYCAA
jgi:D-alanyl-D-alanine carboxypeptidase